MKGLELSYAFYETYGFPMLREQFPHLLPRIAVGLMGSGSDCFGYDDAVSRDHDFEPGFCLFLPDESVVDRKTAFALERAYAKLPREFMGVKRSTVSPVGGNRRGVIRYADFFMEKTGTADGVLTVGEWFSVPEQSLAEATNGRVFWDEAGELTVIRARLSYLPEDVRRKKLAGHLLLMGQSGQYNYERCVVRGETAAAQLAVAEFVKSTLHAVFLLNKKYLPYYKWSFRALRDLPILSALYEPLESILSSGNRESEWEEKRVLIDCVCALVIDEVKKQGLSDFSGEAAEGHAEAVNRSVSDTRIRNLHLLYGV